MVRTGGEYRRRPMDARLSIPACMALIVLLPVRGAEKTPTLPEKELAKASPEKAARDLYRTTAKKNPEQLARLVDGPDDSLALWARWHLLSRSLEKASDQRRLVQCDRFLGWIEGRHRVSVPEWWRFWLIASHAGLSEEGSIAFWEESAKQHPALFERKGKWWIFDPLPLKKAGERLRIPRGTSLTTKGKHFVLEQDGKKVQIEKAVVKDMEEDFGSRFRFRFRLAPQAALLGGTDGVGSPYPLRCVDPKTGRARWKQSVWAIGTRSLSFRSFSGPWQHDADLVVTKDKAFVFGRVTGEGYVEAFDLRTGKCILRFATNGWGFNDD
jgi:hypothetical protein